MYKCEHCGTEFEGRFCPSCGELSHGRKNGKQALEIPKAFQNWQITLIVLAVAAAAALLLGCVWYAKDSTDQAIAELNMARLDNMYLQTPGGQTQEQNPDPEQNEGGTTGGNAGETNQAPAANASSAPAQNEGNTGVQPTDPAPEQEQPSGEEPVSSREIPAPAEPQNPDPAIPTGSLVVPETLSGNDLAKVFEAPMGYYEQKVQLQGTVTRLLTGLKGKEYLEVSVNVNGQEQIVEVYAQNNEHYIPMEASVTIQGQVVGANNDAIFNGYALLKVQATEAIDVALTDGDDTVLRQVYVQKYFYCDNLDFRGMGIYLDMIQITPKEIKYIINIENYSGNYTTNSYKAFVNRQFDSEQLTLSNVSFPVEIEYYTTQSCQLAFKNTIDLDEIFSLSLELQITSRDTGSTGTYTIDSTQ